MVSRLAGRKVRQQVNGVDIAIVVALWTGAFLMLGYATYLNLRRRPPD